MLVFFPAAARAGVVAPHTRALADGLGPSLPAGKRLGHGILVSLPKTKTKTGKDKITPLGDAAGDAALLLGYHTDPEELLRKGLPYLQHHLLEEVVGLELVLQQRVLSRQSNSC